MTLSLMWMKEDRLVFVDWIFLISVVSVVSAYKNRRQVSTFTAHSCRIKRFCVEILGAISNLLPQIETESGILHSILFTLRSICINQFCAREISHSADYLRFFRFICLSILFGNRRSSIRWMWEKKIIRDFTVLDTFHRYNICDSFHLAVFARR